MRYQPIPMDQTSVAAWMLCALLFIITLGVHAQQTDPPMADYINGEPIKQEEEHSAASSKLETIVVLREGEHTLLGALTSIADQAGLKLSYSEQIIPVNKKVRITQETQTAQQALWHTLQGTSYRFGVSLAGQLVLLRTLPPLVQVQPEAITGTVSDASSGETLPGVNILIKGTSTGASTDSDGTFELTVESLQDTLVVSFVGYQTQEVPISGRSTIDIALQPQAITGEEMVVVGYGTQEEENLTGSISQISGDKLENRVLSSPVEGLKGQVPGLNVSVTDAGGEPGATSDFNIRGIGSLSGGSPYVLVDGIPQDLDTVNPQDIKSVSVLKGASASAIYGAKAAYGVILVTTKQGNAGDVNISYSGNVGWNRPTKVPNVVNSVTWMQSFNQASKNGGGSGVYSDGVIQQAKQYMRDPENTPGTIPSPIASNKWSNTNLTPQYTNANTDWYDVFYKRWAMNQTHNLSVSGGNESTTYYISGGAFDRNGQMEFGDDSFQRYNLTINMQTDITDWLDIDISAKYNNKHTEMPKVYGPDIAPAGGFYHELLRRSPSIPLYDPNGNILANFMNVNANGGRNIDNKNMFIGAANIAIQPIAGWEINADFNSQLNFNDGSSHLKEVIGNNVNGTEYALSQTYPTSYFEYKDQNIHYNTNIHTSYEEDLGKHFFKGLIGFQTETFRYNDLSGNKAVLISDNIPSISTATGEDNVDDAKGHWSTKGFFTRLRYNYEEKYFIEFNARADGSSRFPKGDRWGFFPSFSAGYDIASESFWESLRDKVSLLKIRGSYGALGNHDVPNYLYISTLIVNNNLPWIMGTSRPLYVSAPDLISNNLTWETSSTVDLGLDAKMFESRLSLTFDWFQRRTTNMFGPTQSYPDVLGTAPPQKNNADLRTRGFELSLGWEDKIGQVQYYLTAHIADNQSVVTSYQNNEGYIHDYYAGQKIGQIWGYSTEGLYPSDEAAQNDPENQNELYSVWRAGDVNYKDLNGDGEISNGNETLQNHGDLSIIGNSTPRYRYSMDVGLQWKGFNFSMLWGGVGKRDLWMGNDSQAFWGFVGDKEQSTLLESQMDRGFWSQDNKDAYYPKPYLIEGEANKNEHVQTRYLQNGAYLRLQNVQIGYSLPLQWINNMAVESLQIYFSGENLLSISPIMEAFDPEAIATGSAGEIYPISRTLTMGINIDI